MAKESALGSKARNAKALKSRYRRIMRFATHVLVQSWWYELALPSLGFGKITSRGRIKRLTRQAKKFHDLAADLGGLMIKLGQFLSSRLDVLPVEITSQLEGLQDEVKPEKFSEILEQIENELGLSSHEAFSSFEEVPLAAASLGQAHRATLSPALSEDLGFSDVVVKVLRPGIEEIVEVDIRALRKVGVILSKVKLVSKRADAPALVEEFATTSLEEIDYLNEAKNLEKFKANFANDKRVSVPEVIWERTSRRVMALSDVTAIKITDVESLKHAGIDPNAVAAELARVTFEQFFVTGFFHADPHPGNIFVTPQPQDSEIDFSLTFIDFGMMGEITDQQRLDLQRLLFALASRDPRATLEATQKLNFLLPSVDTYELERALETLFERFGGLGVADLIQTDPKEIRDLALQYGQIIRTLPFQLPENYLLLFRSLSLISGVTSSLNRNFNLWDAVDPFARSLLSQGGGLLKTFASQALDILTTLVRLPQRLDNLAYKIDKGELISRAPETERRIRVLDSSVRRATAGIIFSTLLISGILLRNQGDELGSFLMGSSLVPLIYALGLFRGR
jgi:predicted unusual protein kinase regulating ubiquinone biosynthesis (AarF/ABC1/UbiB family)